jgi:hypothetical protein
MRLDDFLRPGRVVRRAQLPAQARPYGLIFGPGRHDAEDGSMGRGRPDTILCPFDGGGGMCPAHDRTIRGRCPTLVEATTRQRTAGAPTPAAEAAQDGACRR